tara:strand:+ start:3099 stop:3212 length:114 start_codon:yes stop_codon:yes gene_type:complete
MAAPKMKIYAEINMKSMIAIIDVNGPYIRSKVSEREI